MKAFISDIHSNLEALQAVLSDAQSQGATEFYCLGDIVGYGPNPRECIDLVKDCRVCLLGNHDQGAMFNPEGFNSPAAKAIFWTRTQLESSEEGNAARFEFLSELPRHYREEPFLFVHGSPRDPLNEYVFPEDIHNDRKMEKLFSLVDRYCFQGHTHVPGIFTETRNFYSPDEINYQWTLKDEKTMVNIGSVGQPRDGNWQACYVLMDEMNLLFRRVEYDVNQTVEKIYGISDLDDFLGDRLREGR